MDTIYSYASSLVDKISSIFWWTGSSSSPANQTEPSESSDKNDVPITKPHILVSGVQEGSSPEQTHSGHSDHPRIPPPYCSNSFTDPNEIAKVDKINLRVKCAGKTMEVDMFPLEKISVLLEEACEWYGKKPEKMSLVYAGNYMDVNMTVSHYGLRGGTTVHLIQA